MMTPPHHARDSSEARSSAANAPEPSCGLGSADAVASACASASLAPAASWSGVWAPGLDVAASGASSPDAAVKVRWRLSSSAKLLPYVAPFVAAVAAYEGIRAFFRHPKFVHVGDLLALEERWFSVSTASGPRALSEIIAAHTHPLLDLWCGITYLLWVPEVFAMTALLFVRARPKALQLALGFFAVNLAGWAIWILYPAAPPWYVDLYGTGPTVIDAPASTAGLARLDALLQVPVAGSLYSKSAYVFGAMPSLHVAYATLVATVAYPLGGKLRAVTLAIAASMAFSALYLRHHYILDVLAGIALAVPVALAVGALLAGVERLRGSSLRSDASEPEGP